jgi:hypothetical protein
LQQLARLRRRLKHDLANCSVDEPDRSAVLRPKTTPATTTEEAASALDVADEEAASVASADPLLSLSPSGLAAFLAEPREFGSKVLLAIIYRLATIEQQMDDLGSYLRGRSIQHSYPAPANVVPPVIGDGGKAEVLEQVFRKNLSLRETT